MKYLSKTIFAVLVLATTHVFAQNSFDSWDTDNDGLLEKHEFTSKFMDKYFSIWSEGADARGIIEEGFFKKSYAGLDTDATKEHLNFLTINIGPLKSILVLF